MRFCNNCGTQISDDTMFCPSCGARQTNASEDSSNGQTISKSFPKFSDWDGGVLETVINSIIASIMIAITCGIATPWAICYIWNFVIGHVTIDGKRLKFDGNGGELFGQWIIWFILTVITCGIYGFWVTPKLYKWIASHTHFAN